jgi:hypothetical protein
MFNLELKEVNYEKIKAWCDEKVPEGETIEYKREFPVKPKLEKIISSMANTYGGIILVGVQADKKLNIPKSIPGIEFEDGLEEKVTGICIRSIYPPVFPDVKPCQFKDKNDNEKAVVFIRVYESDRTPHAINNNTDVYIRIKSQTERFEREATQDERDWLRDRRARAVELRDCLVDRARSRYMRSTGSTEEFKRHYTEVYVLPQFPSRPLFSISEFGKRVEDMINATEENTLKRLLDKFWKGGRSAADTWYFLELNAHEFANQKSTLYSEVDVHGMVYRCNAHWEQTFNESRNAIDTVTYLRQLYRTLREANLLCRVVGFRGLVRVGVHVRGLRWKDICTMRRDQKDIHEDSWGINELEEGFSFEKDLLFQQFDEQLDEICKEIYKNFLWVCGAGPVLGDPDCVTQVRNEYQMAKNYFSL